MSIHRNTRKGTRLSWEAFRNAPNRKGDTHTREKVVAAEVTSRDIYIPASVGVLRSFLTVRN